MQRMMRHRRRHNAHVLRCLLSCREERQCVRMLRSLRRHAGAVVPASRVASSDTVAHQPPALIRIPKHRARAQIVLSCALCLDVSQRRAHAAQRPRAEQPTDIRPCVFQAATHYKAAHVIFAGPPSRLPQFCHVPAQTPVPAGLARQQREPQTLPENDELNFKCSTDNPHSVTHAAADQRVL